MLRHHSASPVCIKRTKMGDHGCYASEPAVEIELNRRLCKRENRHGRIGVWQGQATNQNRARLQCCQKSEHINPPSINMLYMTHTPPQLESEHCHCGVTRFLQLQAQQAGNTHWQENSQLNRTTREQINIGTDGQIIAKHTGHETAYQKQKGISNQSANAETSTITHTSVPEACWETCTQLARARF